MKKEYLMLRQAIYIVIYCHLNVKLSTVQKENKIWSIMRMDLATGPQQLENFINESLFASHIIPLYRSA